MEVLGITLDSDRKALAEFVEKEGERLDRMGLPVTRFYGCVRVFQKCLKRYPESPYRPLHLYGLAQANRQLDRDKDVRKWVELLQREFPGDKHTKWAASLMRKE